MAEHPETSCPDPETVPRPVLVEGIRAVVRTVTDLPENDLKSWAETQAQSLPLCWLFSTHDDGVIWGRFEDNENGTRILRTASDIVWESVNDDNEPEPWVPKLRIETLWELWLFGADAAVHVWRDGDGFASVRIEEVDKVKDNGKGELRAEFEEAVDEWALLWGTHAQSLKDDPVNGFAHVADASAVVEHVLPVRFAELNTVDKNRIKKPVYERRRGYRAPLVKDVDAPDTHLGMPVLWRPCELAVRLPFGSKNGSETES